MAASRFGAEHSHRAEELERRVLRGLERVGCLWAREIPGPRGRTSDFLVRRADARLAVHVKDLSLDPRPLPPMPAWMQRVTRLDRGVIVGAEHVHPTGHAARTSKITGAAGAAGTTAATGAHARRRLDDEAIAFLRRASIGDVHLTGGWLLRVIGPRADGVRRVEVLRGAAADPLVDSARVRRLLDRAYAQFMPRMVNLIVIAGPHDRSLALDIALMGRPMERWDRFPRRGERVAVGRASDGFWEGRSRPESAWVLWMPTSGRGAERNGVLIERAGVDSRPTSRASDEHVSLMEDLREAVQSG